MNHCREEESRTAILLGCSALKNLHNAHVAVFGVGGVGGHVCEALARRTQVVELAANPVFVSEYMERMMF